MSSLRVKYFVPEDGDAPEHPNVFTLRLQSDVLTLHSLRQQFPVPGVYQFRFMSSVGSLTVWRDLLYDDDCIPAQNGAVFIKASRLQAAAATSLPSRPEVSAPAKLRPVPALPPREPSTRLLSFEDSPKPAAETDLLGFDAPQNKVLSIQYTLSRLLHTVLSCACSPPSRCRLLTCSASSQCRGSNYRHP
jgi:hypothetical protein